MKKRDKTQGVVFILPKSREFFGRISKDFEKTAILTQPNAKPKFDYPVKEDNSDLEELKQHLSKLSGLHKRLQELLLELDNLVK